MTSRRDPNQDTKFELDELLSQANTLRNRAESTANSGRHSRSSTGVREAIYSIQEDMSFLRRLIYNISQGYLGFHRRFIAPVWHIATPLVSWIGRWYGKAWNRFVYRKDPQSGISNVSQARAGVFVALTVAVISIFTPTRLGNFVRFVTIEPVSDAILMAASLKTEVFYLNHSEEIDPAANIHSVRGCKNEGACSEIDAAYFRIKPRLSHDVWKLIKHGNPIYIPDHVVAPIAPGVNRCEVTYYGYRMTSSWISRLMRSFEVYPTLLETTCVFVGADLAHQL